MICPYCRHETLNAPVCPSCGLAPDEARRQAAREWSRRGNPSRARALWEEVLQGLPEDREALRQRALCVFQEARGRAGGEEGFRHAEAALEAVLALEWDWEEGHQARLQLYQERGALDVLKERYRKESEDPARRERALRVLEVIDLVERFREAPPRVSTVLPEGSLAFSFLARPISSLVGLPLVLWGAGGVVGAYQSGGRDIGAWFLLTGGFAISLGLWIFAVRRSKKRKEGGDPR